MQLGALTNGIVDYFDARFDTPDPNMLMTYDVVHTWSEFGYAQPDVFGEQLAAFAGSDRCVVLGFGTVRSDGMGLEGAIVSAAWCPVTSSGGTLAGDAYNFDGTTCIWSTTLASFAVSFRESVVLQGAGAIDGTYADGVLAAAFNDPGSGIPSLPRVIYLNGARSGSGTDIPCWVIGAFSCHGIEVDPPD